MYCNVTLTIRILRMTNRSEKREFNHKSIKNNNIIYIYYYIFTYFK